MVDPISSHNVQKLDMKELEQPQKQKLTPGEASQAYAHFLVLSIAKKICEEAAQKMGHIFKNSQNQ